MRPGYRYRLTEHFSLNEFAVSASYPEIAKEIIFNPTDGIKSFYGCATLLQPTRNHFKIPLIITSGKCPPELNKLIRPDNLDSDHLWKGESWAADFILQDGNSFRNEIRAQQCLDWMKEKLPFAFGQLIYYQDGHIHVSLPTERHKNDYSRDSRLP